jgi:hypothetical protein
MELKAGVGFGKIQLGMTESELEALLGRPSEVRSENVDGETEQVWHYNELKLSVSFFSSDDGELGSIRTTGKSLLVDGEAVIGGDPVKVMNALGGEWDKDEDILFTMYLNDTKGLSISVEYGEITEVEQGMPLE